MNKPFIYLCHCGIVDVAVPVMVGDRYIGAVMFGQVRIPNDKTHENVQRLINEISSFNETDGSEELMEMYKALPELTYEKVERIADLLDSIVKYIVKRAMKERAGRMALEYRSRNTLPPVFDGDSEEADLRLGDRPDPSRRIRTPVMLFLEICRSPRRSTRLCATLSSITAMRSE